MHPGAACPWLRPATSGGRPRAPPGRPISTCARRSKRKWPQSSDRSRQASPRSASSAGPRRSVSTATCYSARHLPAAGLPGASFCGEVSASPSGASSRKTCPCRSRTVGTRSPSGSLSTTSTQCSQHGRPTSCGATHLEKLPLAAVRRVHIDPLTSKARPFVDLDRALVEAGHGKDEPRGCEPLTGEVEPGGQERTSEPAAGEIGPEAESDLHGGLVLRLEREV